MDSVGVWQATCEVGCTCVDLCSAVVARHRLYCCLQTAWAHTSGALAVHLVDDSFCMGVHAGGMLGCMLGACWVRDAPCSDHSLGWSRWGTAQRRGHPRGAAAEQLHCRWCGVADCSSVLGSNTTHQCCSSELHVQVALVSSNIFCTQYFVDSTWIVLACGGPPLRWAATAVLEIAVTAFV